MCLQSMDFVIILTFTFLIVSRVLCVLLSTFISLLFIYYSLGYFSRGYRIKSIFMLFYPYLHFLCYSLILSTNLIQMFIRLGGRWIIIVLTLSIFGIDRR